MDEIERKTVKFPVIFSPIRLATTVLNFLWEPFTSGRSTDRKNLSLAHSVMMVCISSLVFITWRALAAFKYLKLL